MALYVYPLSPVTVSIADSATATKQDEQTALLTTIDSDTSALAATDFATETTLSALAAEDFATETTLSSLNAKVTAADTDDVTITSSALPTGAATEASLAGMSAKLPAALGTAAATGSISIVEASEHISGSGSSLNAIVLSAETIGYQSVFLQITVNTSSNTVLWEFSNDNTTWYSSGGVPVPTSASAAPSTGSTVVSMWIIPTQGRYFRLRISNFLGGSVSAVGTLTGLPEPLMNQYVNAAQSGNWTVRLADSAGNGLNVNIGGRTTALRVVHSNIDVADQIDTTPLLDLSSTNIPASSSNPVQVVATTAGQISKIVSVEDIGEFIGLYTGAALSEVLECVLPLGGGEIEVSIPINTRISLRNMKNAAITSGFIALNLIGPAV